jgi:hypothetical protein
MRQLKVIVLSVLILCSLIMLFSLLIPSHNKVSRAINVVAKKEVLLHELSQLQNWKNWHPLLKNKNIDSIFINNNYKEINISNTNFKISSTTDSSVNFAAKNINGEEMHSTIQILDFKDSCIVNWYSTMDVKWYPWEKFRTIFFDNMIGPSLDSSLASFKNYMEHK